MCRLSIEARRRKRIGAIVQVGDGCVTKVRREYLSGYYANFAEECSRKDLDKILRDFDRSFIYFLVLFT